MAFAGNLVWESQWFLRGISCGVSMVFEGILCGVSMAFMGISWEASLVFKGIPKKKL